MTLYKEVSLNSQYNGGFNSVVIGENIVNQKTGIAFARTSATAKISAVKEGSLFNVSASDCRRATFTPEVYFSAIIPRTLPSHGIATWDESDTLILTNESRVLADLTTIGAPGAAIGRTNIDITMPGKWAVNSMGLGSVITHAGSAPGRQPIFRSADVGTGYHDDTDGTRIRGQSSTTTSGATIEATNSGVVITTTSTAAYD